MGIKNIESNCATCEFNRGDQAAKDAFPKVGHCAITGISHPPVRKGCHVYTETTPAILNRLAGTRLLPTSLR
jgi:hypothetical protein